jgi:hypothetical protein
MQWEPSVGFDLAFDTVVLSGPSLNLRSAYNQTVASGKPGI